MIRVWTQFLGTLCLVVLASGALTGSLYNDTERSSLNEFGAFRLDAGLSGTAIAGNVCSVGGPKEAHLKLENLGGLAFEYSPQVTINRSNNALCESTILKAFHNGAMVYEGNIPGFNSTMYTLPSGAHDTWRLQVQLPMDENGKRIQGTCVFKTSFSANQSNFMSGEAFYDIESRMHTFVSTGAGCISSPDGPPGPPSKQHPGAGAGEKQNTPHQTNGTEKTLKPEDTNSPSDEHGDEPAVTTIDGDAASTDEDETTLPEEVAGATTKKEETAPTATDADSATAPDPEDTTDDEVPADQDKGVVADEENRPETDEQEEPSATPSTTDQQDDLKTN